MRPFAARGRRRAQQHSTTARSGIRVRSRRTPARARVRCRELSTAVARPHRLQRAKGNRTASSGSKSRSSPILVKPPWPMLASEPVAHLQKCHLRRRFALKPASRRARRGLHQRTRSTSRLLEHPAEIANRLHPVRSIHTQPVQNGNAASQQCGLVEQRLRFEATGPESPGRAVLVIGRSGDPFAPETMIYLEQAEDESGAQRRGNRRCVRR
jgi:hypothetical protein